ncbi:hypothetical protein BpOF4_05165 [Alkalihalophilus pseudofirmus OF4]|uniref:Uncharacterized protein n=2 Tax=Alkalihalophilus TaxID=2893060 RepID=D3FY72_ALKPO|nr:MULTISPECIES: hypothetical protein [Alkalihalophilus]ADC49095.1 hypothetical protein BpOF4_05165 [Alkalihalophilus pseudofirmus OF4]ERN52286.1 hypothetical protein A33I_17415 [Alkalihalophilus marmarensis DSM 21297]MED1600009.1 hypothetical protein [Alkalihalophilus marmarensis]
MRQFTAQSTMIMSDLKKSFITFWAILTGFVLFFLLLVLFLGIPNMIVMTNAPMYVFLAIFGYRLLSSGDFEHAIHLGTTRKAFVFNVTIFTLLLSLVFSLINQLYIFFIDLIQSFLIQSEITFFTWDSVLSSGNGFWVNLVADGLIMSMLGMLLFFLASLQVRFGQWAMLSVVAASVLLLFIPAIHTPIIDWMITLPNSGTFITEFLVMLALTFVLGVISYFSLSKASI